jgi:hypothetical protein
MRTWTGPPRARNAFTADFQDLITRYTRGARSGRGRRWTCARADPRHRDASALGRWEEFEMHVRGGPRRGRLLRGRRQGDRPCSRRSTAACPRRMPRWQRVEGIVAVPIGTRPRREYSRQEGAIGRGCVQVSSLRATATSPWVHGRPFHHSLIQTLVYVGPDEDPDNGEGVVGVHGRLVVAPGRGIGDARRDPFHLSVKLNCPEFSISRPSYGRWGKPHRTIRCDAPAEPGASIRSGPQTIAGRARTLLRKRPRSGQ